MKLELSDVKISLPSGDPLFLELPDGTCLEIKHISSLNTIAINRSACSKPNPTLTFEIDCHDLPRDDEP